MNVHLERTIEDHVQKRRCNVYRREDGNYTVLVTPSNPRTATDENVFWIERDTQQEALDACEETLR